MIDCNSAGLYYFICWYRIDWDQPSVGGFWHLALVLVIMILLLGRTWYCMIDSLSLSFLFFRIIFFP